MTDMAYCPECRWRTRHKRGVCVECAPDEPPAPPCPETIPLALFPTTPPSNGIETSDEAAASLTAEKLDEYQRRILSKLLAHHVEGMTREALSQATGIKGDTIRPRLLELVEMGLVCCRDDKLREVPFPVRGQPSTAARVPTDAGRSAFLLYPSDKALRRSWRERWKSESEAA